MKRHAAILLTLAMPLLTLAQGSSNAVSPADTTWPDRGFDFHIAAGMFTGSTFNANYYNGSNLNECNIDYIFTNQYWREEWQRMVTEYYPYISISDELTYNDPNDMDWNMHYSFRTVVGLAARYKFGNGWGLSLSYQYSQLKATTQILLSSNAVSGNMVRQPVVALVGKENRSMFDLSVSYLFSRAHRTVKPFVEAGVQFNYAKVKSFDAVLLDQNSKGVGNSYTLLDPYNGQGYYPGAQTYDNIVFGGPGYGFSAAAGLKLVCIKSVSLDPTFYAAFARTGIYEGKNKGGENKFAFSYGIMLRVVMSDYFFAN